jgi:hypothetical protein
LASTSIHGRGNVWLPTKPLAQNFFCSTVVDGVSMFGGPFVLVSFLVFRTIRDATAGKIVKKGVRSASPPQYGTWSSPSAREWKDRSLESRRVRATVGALSGSGALRRGA